MSGWIMVMTLGIVLVAAGIPAHGGQNYFVSMDGNDAHEGTSHDRAFRTVQAGVDALQAGDVLTIAPGEYHESVSRRGLGNEERQTTIRAAIPGTAVLRGDVPAPPFAAVEGLRFVYAASFEQLPLAVMEHDTLRVLHGKAALREVEFEPGSFYYDDQAQVLYLSPSDLRSPAGRKYTITVKPGSGLFLDRPTRVVIDGLVATGFGGASTGHHWIRNGSWGIALDEPTASVVQRSRVFLNAGGIGLANGRDNRIDACIAYGHRTHNILVFGGPNNRDNVIENSYAYRAPSGMHFYAAAAGPMTLRNNIAWGHDLDFSNKTGHRTSEEFGVVERCVGVGDFQANGLRHTLMGGRNEYDRRLEASRDNILLLREDALDLNREFADPDNMDFRLQADSRFRANGDEPDRGPFPYEPNIRYLSPDGSDENDGLAVSRPWRTLTFAIEQLKPGDTLYLEAGRYDAPTRASIGEAGGKPIRIAGRGHGTVIVEGPLALEHISNIELERLNFIGSITLREGAGIKFRNCRFGGDEGGLISRKVRSLHVEHCVFANHALRLTDSLNVLVRGNLFVNHHEPAVVVQGDDPFAYVDYNAYADATRVRQTQAGDLQLADVQRQGRDVYSLARDVALMMDGGVPRVADKTMVRGWGPYAGTWGVHHEYSEPSQALAGPFVHSTTDTTADLEWWTSEPMAVALSWGRTPDMEHRVEIPRAYQYAGYNLTGLEAGETYYVRVQPRDDGHAPVPAQAWESQLVHFCTNKSAPAPQVYHVAMQGDDRNEGLSRSSAFRTVGRAAAAVNAGDTVLIGEGVYPERVWVRASGTHAQPITFRAVPGEKARVRSFSMVGRRYIHLDALYTSSVLNLVSCEGIKITRCFSQGPLLEVRQSADVLVHNSVVTRGYPFAAVAVWNSPNVRLEHNVILHPSIYGAFVHNEADQKFTMRRNIFTDSIPFKARVAYFEIGRAESLVIEENCFYMRGPDPQQGLKERDMFLFYDDEAYDRGSEAYGVRPASEQEPSVITKLTRACLVDYERFFGPTGSVMTNPRFHGGEDVAWKEGERFTTGNNLGNANNNGFLILEADRIMSKPDLDFPDLFTAHPQLKEKGIGLLPQAFEDFHFNPVPESKR